MGECGGSEPVPKISQFREELLNGAFGVTATVYDHVVRFVIVWGLELEDDISPPE